VVKNERVLGCFQNLEVLPKPPSVDRVCAQSIELREKTFQEPRSMLNRTRYYAKSSSKP
jgi:hypothetical protein